MTRCWELIRSSERSVHAFNTEPSLQPPQLLFLLLSLSVVSALSIAYLKVFFSGQAWWPVGVEAEEGA